MDWQKIYNERKVSAEEAVTHIKSGDRIALAHACGEPTRITDALVANAAAYENVEIVHMVAMGKCAYCAPEMAPHFRHIALFVGGGTRDAVNSGRADFIPCHFSNAPELFRTSLHCNVAIIQVSTPDEEGYCSLGIAVDYTKAAAENAETVIALVNDQYPHMPGDNKIHVSKLNYIVEASDPVIPLAPPKIGEVEKAIGENCAKLVKDGDTLQLGIGAIPDAVLLFLKDKKDLGIHSEMISDGVMALMKAGVITNAKKNLHPGQGIITFAMGSPEFYKFLDGNQAVASYPVDYVNDPYVIAQNDNLVSINSCVQVDLMGQVASESIGPKQISGTGGQVDFVRGANMSKGGRSIIAFGSTTGKGKVSKIVAQLDPGAVVTTLRNDVDYIVTEYGIAQLKGKTLIERGRALIAIAHPDFRPALIEAFEARYNCKY